MDLIPFASEIEIPFVSEVEEFNNTFGKSSPEPNVPKIPNKSDWMFVYNFILEELNEYKEACENGDVVGALDALCDITYVSLGNGTLTHGFKEQILPAYAEVHASNMSKACKTVTEAEETILVRSKEHGPCHYEEHNGYFIVYRSSDRKVMKSINYTKPNLEQFLK